MIKSKDIIRKVPTSEQREFVRNYLEQGSIANRGSFDGDETQQRIGILAQTIVCDLLGLERPKQEGFDGGYDITTKEGKRLDVKCLKRKGPFKVRKYVHAVPGYQAKYDIDGYIFVSFNSTEGIFEICGMLWKDDLQRVAEFVPEDAVRYRGDGTRMNVSKGGFYAIDQRHLTEVVVR